MEIWKDIIGYENSYQISDLGKVKSLKRYRNKKEFILKSFLSKDGYLIVSLCKNSICKKYSIHRLVAIAFIPNLYNKLEVNHINGDKSNNNVNNLEWCTSSENQLHAYRTGLQLEPWKGKFGINHCKSIKVNQYNINNKFIKKWDSIAEAGEKLKLHSTSISACCKNKLKTTGGFIWKYYDEKMP